MTGKQILLRLLQCLAVVILFSLPSLCSDQVIVIRFIDGRDGTPLADEPVIARSVFGTTTQVETMNTDAKGEARLVLYHGKPDSLDIQVKINSPELACSCRVLTDTETVLRDGVVKFSRRTPKSARPTPGQVLFVAGPSSLLHKALYLGIGSP